MLTKMFKRNSKAHNYCAQKALPVVKVIAFTFIIIGSAIVNAGPTILELANNNNLRLPDYSYAGYKHGEVEIPVIEKTIVNIIEYGAKADDGLDDSQAILSALEKAHSIKGPVVLMFPRGQLIVSEVLRIRRSNIVLRGVGSGEGGTTLFFPRPLKMIDKGESLTELTEYLIKYEKRQKELQNNINELFSEYSWSGGFIWVQKEGTRAAPYLQKNDPEINVVANAYQGQAGSRQLSVDSAKKLKVGDVLELQWLNKSGDKGPILGELYGNTDLEIGSHHWSKPERPLVRQKTEIISIQNTLITISDPLLHTISTEIPAQFAQWDHMTEVGIEDLHLLFPDAPSFGHHLEQGYNGIYFTSVYNGWIRNLKITNADSGALTYNSANLTITDIQSEGNRRGHYAVQTGNVHNVLVKNLMINNPLQHSLSFNTQATKSVFLNAHVFKEPVLDQHAGSNHQNLFDNIHVYFTAQRNEQGKAYYPIWNGSGAGYWQPGHGRYNTTWNLNVTVLGGAERSEKVVLLGEDEGPEARIVGVSGNRSFDIDYRPTPYIEAINRPMDAVPSLYRWQLNKRLNNKTNH